MATLRLRKAFTQLRVLGLPKSVLWAKERAPRQLVQVKSPRLPLSPLNLKVE